MGRVRWAKLIDLWDAIEGDPAYNKLRFEPAVKLVPGEGPDHPKAMVIGQNPGALENTLCRPFVGPSGKVLEQLMSLAGLSRSTNAWVTNTVKYMSPGNRMPTPLEALAAKPHLQREWQVIGAPRLIVCVGGLAQDAITPGERLEKGNIFHLKNGVYVCHQFHPAYGLRGGDDRKAMMEEQWETMGQWIQELKKELAWD